MDVRRAEADRLTSTVMALLILSHCCCFLALITTVAREAPNAYFSHSRLCTRIFMIKRFGLDDVFIGVGVAGLVANAPLVHFIALDLSMAIRTTVLGTLGDQLLLLFKMFRWAKLAWITSVMYPPVVTYGSFRLIKLSIIVFYRHFLPRRPYLPVLIATAVFLTLFGAATCLASILQCNPVSLAWNPFTAACNRVNIYALNFIICSVGIATDLAILLLPVRVVLRLQMSTKRRVMLVVLFSMGLLGTALTTLRLWALVRIYQLSQHLPHDEHWMMSFATMTLVSVLELSVIAVCANLPTMAALWRHAQPKAAAALRGAAAGKGPPGMGVVPPKQAPSSAINRRADDGDDAWDRYAAYAAAAASGRRGDEEEALDERLGVAMWDASTTTATTDSGDGR